MTSALRPKSGYIPTLDGWRAIAVALVLFYHAPAPQGAFQGLQKLQHLGSFGVDLFFAISGLLICSRLLEEERLNGSISLRGFYIRRSFRIFPAAFVYLFTIALLGLVHVLPTDWPAWASAVVFVRNYFGSFVRDTTYNHFTGHFWSLAVEEHFYLILPALLVLFPKHRKLALWLLTGLAMLWFAVYVLHTPPDLRSISWERRTDLRIGSLLLPATLALYLVGPSRATLERWVHPTYCLVLIVVIVVLFLVKGHFYPAALKPVNPAIYDVDNFVTPRGGDVNVLHNIIIPFAFPLLVLATLLHPLTWIGRLLEAKVLRHIGRVSYSVYLWQELFWGKALRHWPIAHIQKPYIVVVTIPLAALASYFLIEKPCIRWGHRLAPPPTPGHRDLGPAT
jgi:peptidoglycan/LPS O-acetylase OafA/YrhL